MPLHPVVEVLVAPGDRVKKGQVLVKIDDDEPQADVRAKKAALESADLVLKDTRRHLDVSEKAHAVGALSDSSYFFARLAAQKAEQEQRAAKAALESAEAELEHYTVVSFIDGIVAWLDVSPGMVSRPGTTTWGEVMDLKELDVRCDVQPEQAEWLAVGQAVEIRLNGKAEVFGMGKVATVSIAAEKATGLIPVLVRVPNPKLTLRCHVPVHVRFIEAITASK